jgi:predicted CoA-binding protein
MTDVARLLGETKTVLLIDWPSREVPDTLARRGYTVISNDGPEKYNAYEAEAGAVRTRDVGRLPERVDLVYAHRPIDELPEIVATAKSIGAKAVWVQSGRDESGAKDPRGCWFAPEDSSKARAIVEGAGLTYIESPYIGNAVREFRS